MSDEHKRLLTVMKTLPEDYDPWGQNQRWKNDDERYPDCSSGCKWARWLEDLDEHENLLSMDWCVCTNPASHRVGLLTFEHQGCQMAEFDPSEDDDE